MNEVLSAHPTLSDPEALFQFTSGPRDAKAILVGEAWGAEEASAKRPFVGSSGKELDRILADSGLRRDDILCTNLIPARPPANDFTAFLYPTPKKGLANAPAAFRGIYPKPELLDGYRRLHRLIAAVDPLVVIAAGNWPLWALTDHAECKTVRGFKLPTGIAKWRGSQTFSIPLQPYRGQLGDILRDSGFDRMAEAKESRPYPVLPIIHPAAILREWGWRQITVRDLQRAANYLPTAAANRGSHGDRQVHDPARSSFRGWTAPADTFTLSSPSWQQIVYRLDQWRARADAGPELWLACDLETWKRRYISVIGLADDRIELCIPLFSVTGGQVKNLLTLSQECQLFAMLRELLEHPNVKLIGQNFIYDTEWLFRYYNIRAVVSFDTMVAHHLLFPGTPKRLDYLASLYCSHFLYWKDESWDLDGDIGPQLWKYNCKDLRATYEISTVLRKVLSENPELEALYAFQMEQWKLSRQLTLTGIAFDISSQKEMRLRLLEEATQIGEWLSSAVPLSWRSTSTGKPWYDSPKGTADLMYSCLGLSPVLHKKTKRPTTDDSALQELSEKAGSSWLRPLFDRLRHLRSLGVFTSNFLEARTSPDGRMRSSFNIAHPETFRWSSNRNGFGEGLNGQNLPKGDKETEQEIDALEPGDNFFATDDPDL